MTEDEWETCGDAGPMLAWLSKSGRLGGRKSRLLWVGRARGQAAGRTAHLASLLRTVEDVINEHPCEGDSLRRRSSLIHDLLVNLATAPPGMTPAEREVFLTGQAALRSIPIRPEAWATEADLVRELFGNPFRKVRRVRAWLLARVAAMPPDRRPPDLLFAFEWLTWQGGLVPRLAEGIVADRDFGRLPVLGDALEEAGCQDAGLLDHLRSGGPHALGCWALDLILGRD